MQSKRSDGVIQQELCIQTRAKGLHNITSDIDAVVRKSGVSAGLCNVFVQHTSDTAKENETIALKHAAHKAHIIEQKLQQLFAALDSFFKLFQGELSLQK